jgi:hypothetical protein
MFDLNALKLLKGKKALVTGVANDQSIAWGCAQAFRGFGADIAMTYLNDKAKPHVEPLAKQIEAPILMPLDLRREGDLEAVFERVEREWGRLDLLPALDRLRAGQGPSGTGGRLFQRGLSHRHGDLLLVVHSHGQARRTSDEIWRCAFHDDVLRLPNGRGPLWGR